jgi:predicted esterase
MGPLMPAATVHGGAGGIMAHLVDLEQLSLDTAELGEDLALAALCGHQLLGRVGMLSAALDPAGWAKFETSLLAALDGPCGLTALALALSARAAALRTAALAYRATDEARGVALSPAAIRAAVRGASLLYPDGQPIVADRGLDPAGAVVPAGLADLVAALGRRGNATTGAGGSEIDVRVLTRPDGTHAYIVDIPGTRSWELNPFSARSVVNDFGTNLHAMDGQATTYERGVAEALRRAGATPVDPVMLVGHSQGGIVAASAARHFVTSGEFAVTHLVTAGAPIGHLEIPAAVAVLSLENVLDPVPYLDAAPNPDRPNRTTVTFATLTEDPHSLASSYAPAAARLDRSDNSSVRAFLSSATRFLDPMGCAVTTNVYEVSRETGD